MSNRIDPVELSQALIRCASVTPEDGGSLAVLENALTGLGFTCHRQTFSDEGTPDVQNLYARIGDQAPNFCFAGHTDVVPVGDPEGWTVAPFGAEIIDGVLFGRGASDMKSAIACFTAAAAGFIDKGEFGGSISLLITGDEEGPAINGTKKLLQWTKDQGEIIDACVVGEPTNPLALGDMIKIGRRGSLNATLTVFGVQGHTAYPHLADNPIHRLVKMIDAITSLEHPARTRAHTTANTASLRESYLSGLSGSSPCWMIILIWAPIEGGRSVRLTGDRLPSIVISSPPPWEIRIVVSVISRAHYHIGSE